MIVTVLAKFLYLFAASMCLGLAFGLGTSFLMKTFRSNSVPQARLPRKPMGSMCNTWKGVVGRVGVGVGRVGSDVHHRCEAFYSHDLLARLRALFPLHHC